MTRTKVIILIACILSMGAGVEVGMLRARTEPGKEDSRASWLIKELNLTPDQQRGMEAIWKEMVRSKGAEFRDEMMKLHQEREAAVAGLMSPEQSEKYQQIHAQFMEKGRQLWKRMEQEFLAAAEKTRQLLNETQRVRYDILLKQFQEQHNGGEWFGMGPMGRGAMGRGPATLPDGAR